MTHLRIAAASISEYGSGWCGHVFESHSQLIFADIPRADKNLWLPVFSFQFHSSDFYHKHLRSLCQQSANPATIIKFVSQKISKKTSVRSSAGFFAYGSCDCEFWHCDRRKASVYRMNAISGYCIYHIYLFVYFFKIYVLFRIWRDDKSLMLLKSAIYWTYIISHSWLLLISILQLTVLWLFLCE